MTVETIMYQIGEILVLLGLFTTLVGAVTMIYNIPEKDSTNQV